MTEEGILFRIGANIDGLRNTLQREIPAAVDEMSRSFGSKMQSMGRQWQDIGKSMSLAITAPLAAFSGLSLSAFGDFEATMKRVGLLAEATGSDFEKLKNQAMDLGAKTQFSAKQAADAMAEFGAAGFNAAKIYDAMPGTLALASAGQLKLGQAAEISGAILNGFGLKAAEIGKVANVIAEAANKSAASVQDMGVSFKYVGPVASAAGLSLEQTAASLALLSNAGIKGEKGGTALRNMLSDLIEPSKQASKAMNSLGINVTDANGKLLPMGDLLQRLGPLQNNLSAGFQIFGVRFSEVLPLIKAGKTSFEDLEKVLQSSAQNRSAEKMAQQLNQGWNAIVESFKGSVETTMIRIGEIVSKPAGAFLKNFAEPMMNGIGNLAEAFGKLPQPVQNVGLAMVGFAAAAGPAMLMLGKLTEIAGTLQAGNLINFAGAWNGLKVAMMAVLPVAVSVAGAFLFVDSLTELGKQAGNLATQFGSLIGSWKALAPVADAVKAKFYEHVDAWSKLGGTVMEAVVKVSKAIGLYVGDSKIFKAVAAETSEFIGRLGVAFTKLGQSDTWITALKQALVPTYSLAAALGQLSISVSAITGKYPEMDEAVGNAVARMQSLATASGRVTQAQLEALAATSTKLKANDDMANAMARHAEQARLAAEQARLAALGAIGPTRQHTQAVIDTEAAYRKAQASAAAYEKGVQAVAVAGGNALARMATEAQKAAAEVDRAFDGLEAALLKINSNLEGVGQAGLDYLQSLGIGIGDLGDSIAEASNEAATQITADSGRIQTGIQTVAKDSSALGRQISSIFTDLSRDIAKSIVEWKGFGEAGIKTVKSIAEAMVRMLVEEAIGGALKGMSKLIGSLGEFGSGFSKLFSGGGSSGGGGGAGGGVPGVGGGAMGGVTGAVGGITGVVGAIGSIGTMISSIVGNFQMAGMNKTLDLLEKGIRYSEAHLLHILENSNKYWPLLNNTIELLRLEAIERYTAEGNEYLRMMASGGNIGEMFGAAIGQLATALQNSQAQITVNLTQATRTMGEGMRGAMQQLITDSRTIGQTSVNWLKMISEGVWATYSAVAKAGAPQTTAPGERATYVPGRTTQPVNGPGNVINVNLQTQSTNPYQQAVLIAQNLNNLLPSRS